MSRNLMSLRYSLSTLCLIALPLMAQKNAPAALTKVQGEWRNYGNDTGNTHYSPLDQINASNFSNLQVAWRFKTSTLGPRKEYNLQSTPLMVNGVLYSTGGSGRAVVALNAATGAMLWSHLE